MEIPYRPEGTHESRRLWSGSNTNPLRIPTRPRCAARRDLHGSAAEKKKSPEAGVGEGGATRLAVNRP
jgi:hypothetical protein